MRKFLSGVQAASSQVAEMCTTVMDPNSGNDPLHRLSFLYKEMGCTSSNYQDQIDLLSKTSWDAYWVRSGSIMIMH